MPDDFEAYWRKAFPDCDPAGYMLREQLPERWWRLHSLPLSKRYPDEIGIASCRERGSSPV